MRRDHRLALAKLRAGDWQTAHAIVQPLKDPLACRIHALCHRIEGDLGNARYWYRCARQPFPGRLSIEDELAMLARETGQPAKVASRKA